MKKFFLKYKFSYLLAILTILSVPRSATAHAQDVINDFGKLVKEMDENLDRFLNKKDTRPYRTHVKTMKETIKSYNHLFISDHVTTNHEQQELEKESWGIVREFRKSFVAIYNVLVKYQKQSKTAARYLVKDLEAIPLRKLLPKLKTKLMSLKQKAIQENNLILEQIIKQFVAYIDKRIKVWSKKSQLELFGALCRRMELR